MAGVTTSDAGHTMGGIAGRLEGVATMLCVCALAIALYDVQVRQPRTPRLAVVDIARLYAAADANFKVRALTRDAGQPGDLPMASTRDQRLDEKLPGTAPDRLAARARTAQEFGPELEAVLKVLSGECRCAIVAMATVIGGDSTVPDYTLEAAQRMGLSLRGTVGQ